MGSQYLIKNLLFWEETIREKTMQRKGGFSLSSLTTSVKLFSLFQKEPVHIFNIDLINRAKNANNDHYKGCSYELL
jgi:hypothetical protein